MPGLAGMAHRVSAQHRFGIKKLPFKFSDLLLFAKFI
jgi:hypothetical protein